MSNEKSSLKIVICGNKKVGKRSLIHRWAYGVFDSTKPRPDNCTKTVLIGSEKVTVDLRAIRAEDFYNAAALGRSFFSDIDGLALVYDITDPKSLSVMAFWLEQIAKRVTNGSFPVSFLIGNKSDDDGGSNATKPKAVKKFFDTELRLRASHRVSAKSGENVDSTFRHLLACCLVTKMDPARFKYLLPPFMLKALGKIGSKVRLKYESRADSPFDSGLDGLEPLSTNSPGMFIRSRMADDLPALLNSSRFLTIMKIAVQTSTFPVAKVALKCLQKLLMCGYLDNCVGAVEDWVDVLAVSHPLMASAPYQALISQSIFTILSTVRNCRQDILLKAFGICYHLSAIGEDEACQEALERIFVSVVRNECDVGVQYVKSNLRLSVFTKDPDRSDEKQGLELVLAYIDEKITVPVVHKKNDETTEMDRPRCSNTAVIFDAACWLSTGYNRFVKVKGLPPYKHKSRLIFLKLITKIVQHLSNPVEIFFSCRETFHAALIESGISTQLDLIERLIAFISLCIDKIDFTSEFRAEVGTLLKLMFFILESPNTPPEIKLPILKMMINMTTKQYLLLQLFISFDVNIHHSDLFAKMTSFMSQLAEGHLSSILPTTNGRPFEEEPVIRKDSFRNMISLLRFLSQTSKLKQKHTSRITKAFLKQRKKKKRWLEGVNLFNQSPVKGIAFLQDHDLMGSKPSEIVKAVRNECRMDRMAIGDYLGEPDSSSIAVMASFFKSFDFANHEFLQALRAVFLHGFRLPGEAQKVDRIMEKFAARYFECNPHKEGSKIASASAAHTLAFSIIMLNTDLHSPQLKQHMSKEAFVKNMRGTNDSQDFQREYLEQIYDAVAKEKLQVSISLAEIARQTATPTRGSNGAGSRISLQQQVNLVLETEVELLRLAADESLRSVDDHETQQFDQAYPPSCVIQAMFEVAWSNFQGVFKNGLDGPDDEIAGTCIDGIYHALQIANDFSLTEIHASCIAMLSSFTDRIASAQISESMLNLIAIIGGKEFITSFLRSSV